MLLFYNLSVSQNLVQNGSFESYNTPTDWNNWGGGFFDTSVFPFQRILNNWDEQNSADCFISACTHTYAGVPVNKFGDNSAKDGNNYVGFQLFPNSSTYEAKEYIYQYLNAPLEAGKNYCLTFYVSKADRKEYAIKNIGAFFSATMQSPNTSGYINAIPQVENQSGFITDTIQWVQIQGCFTATGGEQCLMIGNFNSNANTDTLYVGTNHPISGDPEYAYYYMDDITLMEDISTEAREISNDRYEISVFPNPNNGIMQMEYDLGMNTKATMKLFDVTGRQIKSYPMENNNGRFQIDEGTLNNGIYFYRIFVGDKVVKSDKIIVLK